MFTGIIEETGAVEKIARGKEAIALVVRAGKAARGLKIGGSLAVNGCCLTATKISTRGKSRLLHFDLLAETWMRTNFQFLKTGSLLNLERPLSAGDEFGGHFVTGHIDGRGEILRWEQSGADHVLDIAAPESVMRYVIEKGSIAIDGISLTVAGVNANSFRVWIIPHTFTVTNLRKRNVGEVVNLEADMFGKYVEKFVRK
ncbi:MAG TPA: riboflavin synthase [Candidatus Sulfotelmatobacter sp.]|nr:riboflavin synthase [Candidatus Sulfotelmatobacter sp.]